MLILIILLETTIFALCLSLLFPQKVVVIEPYVIEDSLYIVGDYIYNRYNPEIKVDKRKFDRLF